MLERTFDSGLGNACLFDLDYFQLERYGSAAPTRTPALTLTRTLTSTRTAIPTITATLTAGPVTIHYTYDELNRLKSADDSTNQSYVYTYDPVGNRTSEQTTVNGLASTVQYGYDDANGNLLNDGANTYAYDAANRLSTVHSPSSTVSYAYNGMGDRLQQTIGSVQNNYVMDLNAGLTQVLDDGTDQYIYGDDRIAQINTSIEYFLGDALGSVRQLTKASGAVTLAQRYDPYVANMSSSRAITSTFGYTGEQTDPMGMIYLRARYYDPTWAGLCPEILGAEMMMSQCHTTIGIIQIVIQVKDRYDWLQLKFTGVWK